jgi:2-C-methyl-D-erythritol 4-phosphate cytidylyltransferase
LKFSGYFAGYKNTQEFSMKSANTIKKDYNKIQNMPIFSKCSDSSGEEEILLYALIMAGGSGQRIGGDIPKQFIELAGKPVLMHTIQVFADFDCKIEIILVLPENQKILWQQLCLKHDFKVPHKIATGGSERFFSVKNGLDLIETDGIVFIHDGVRPLVSQQTLKRCLDLALLKGNALPVVPVSESVRFSDQDGSKPINREIVKLVQTPQTFRISQIKEAYQQPYNSVFTDDASVLENSGHFIYLTEGNRENIKITWPADLVWAKAFLNSQ